MFLYTRSLEIKDETVSHRRFFHQNAEVGLEMPLACKYVSDELKKLGLSPKRCGKGICATVGTGGKTLLLRADMDALPMAEQSGEEFACTSGKTAHTCGHDLHAAMLLSAAKLICEHKSELNGTVKLMFQPAEETLQGCKNMVDAGVLNDPKPDGALAFHVAPGKIPLGIYMYNAGGVMMNSSDGFRVEIRGKGGHGAYPNLAIDPINIATHIYLSLKTLISTEVDPMATCTLSIGKIQAGETYNVIPDSAVLEGSLRTNDPATREKMVKRIRKICEQTAEMFGGSAEVSDLANVPPLVCNKAFTEQMVSYIEELDVPNLRGIANMSASASEDFAVIAEQIPSAFIYLSAGFEDERGEYSAHNPKVRFNEEALPIGTAMMAHCALRWLSK